MDSGLSPRSTHASGNWKRWYLERWLPHGWTFHNGQIWARLVVLAIIAAILSQQLPSLLAHMQRSADPNCFNDDVRQQIFPFFRYADSTLFREDYISDYYLKNLPIGYRSLYTLAGGLGRAEALSKLLPYVLLVIVIAAVAVAAHRLAGVIGAVTASAIVLGCGLYLGRMGGGLPRSFGFPLVAMAMAAMATGRATALAVITCVAACVYPVVGVISGVVLAAWLLLLPRPARGRARRWSFGRRVLLLSATASICVATLVPTALATARFGPIITVDRLEEFPEIGPGGRYKPADRAPFAPWPKALRSALSYSLFGWGNPWSPGMHEWVTSSSDPSHSRQRSVTELLAIGGLFVWLCNARRHPALARLILLGPAAVLCYLASARVAPVLYLPERYLTYTVPLMVCLIASSWLPLGWRLVSRVQPPPTAVAVLSLVMLGFVGGSGSSTAGIATCVDPNNPVLSAVASLPPSSLVAAWPDGDTNLIPYRAKRRVFVSSETHQAFHVGFTLEMRRRMSALIDAYSADSAEPIIRLYREFGVTHLVIRDEFVSGVTPSYFRPFDTLIVAARERLGGRVPQTVGYVDRASVFRSDHVAILSLERIANEPGEVTTNVTRRQ